MSREIKKEIKYRIWDKTCKEMAVVKNIIFDYVDEEDGWYEEGHVVGLHRCDLLPWDEVELMQFTGLKDIHKNPIYEGDIIRCHIVTPNKKWWEVRVVEYDSDMARFGAETPDGKHSSPLPSNLAFNANPVRIDKCEVIGNLYEHSHLLEDWRGIYEK